MVGSTPVKILESTLSRNVTDTVIIGAGPYGLSLAAHLRGAGRSLRIFGAPMDFWSSHMPRGMRLKSEGFASDLYDSGGQFTLKEYCAGNNIPYRDIGLPVRLDTFVAYGLEFQRRYVPDLENVRVVSLSRGAAAFSTSIASSGEALSARRVVVAAGILYFAYVPPVVSRLPAEMVSHSSAHSDLGKFRGRRVAVLGAGAYRPRSGRTSSRGGGHRRFDRPKEAPLSFTTRRMSPDRSCKSYKPRARASAPAGVRECARTRRWSFMPCRKSSDSAWSSVISVPRPVGSSATQSPTVCRCISGLRLPTPKPSMGVRDCRSHKLTSAKRRSTSIM